ncbi:MAG: ABC-2 transporter permease [Lachnospiraceae bacterium]|nr:ABC-2 transporter permease [Lachnospiraceae bacterium]
MKGLLIKDFKLVMIQKYALLVIVGVMSLMTFKSDNRVFAIAYMTFVGTLFALSTISYDEADNGNAFLFALPISRRDYVAEKYLFGLLLGSGFWLFGTLLSVTAAMAVGGSRPAELMETAVLIFPLLFGLLALMFPFQLKFGGERGRIAIIAAIGLVCLVGVGIQKLGQLLHVDLAAMFRHLPGMSTGTVAALAIGAGLVVLLISYRISVGIMNRKEF